MTRVRLQSSYCVVNTCLEKRYYLFSSSSQSVSITFIWQKIMQQLHSAYNGVHPLKKNVAYVTPCAHGFIIRMLMLAQKL